MKQDSVNVFKCPNRRKHIQYWNDDIDGNLLNKNKNRLKGEELISSNASKVSESTRVQVI